jgi:hypothetical protein
MRRMVEKSSTTRNFRSLFTGTPPTKAVCVPDMFSGSRVIFID